jgi:hypothetical protein
MRAWYLLILFATLTWVSCSSPSDTTVTIGSSMTGTVKLYNTDAGTYATDASGANVAILGTNYRTTSDASGKWTLNGVAPGIYTIQFTKQGYDTASLSDHKFSGAGVDFIDEVTVHTISTASLTLDSIVVLPLPPDSDLVFYGTYNAPKSTPVAIEGSSNSDWVDIESEDVQWNGTHFVISRYYRSLARFLSDPSLGGTISFRAVARPEYGPVHYSNVVTVTIPPRQIVLDSATYDPTKTIWDSAITISGHIMPANTRVNGRPDLWVASSPSGEWKIVSDAVRWTSGRFDLEVNAPDVKWRLTGNTDSGPITAYFKVQVSTDYGDLISNIVSLDIP